MTDLDLVPRLVALSLVLFTVGIFGVLARRSALVVVLSLQLMFAAGQLAFVAFERAGAVAPGDPTAPAGHAFAWIAGVIAVVQLVVGLAVVGAGVRRRDSVDLEDARAMRW